MTFVQRIPGVSREQYGRGEGIPSADKGLTKAKPKLARASVKKAKIMAEPKVPSFPDGADSGEPIGNEGKGVALEYESYPLRLCRSIRFPFVQSSARQTDVLWKLHRLDRDFLHRQKDPGPHIPSGILFHFFSVPIAVGNNYAIKERLCLLAVKEWSLRLTSSEIRTPRAGRRLDGQISEKLKTSSHGTARGVLEDQNKSILDSRHDQRGAKETALLS